MTWRACINSEGVIQTHFCICNSTYGPDEKSSYVLNIGGIPCRIVIHFVLLP